MQVIDVVREVLTQAGIDRPDGRLLHAYNITNNHYSRMHQALLRVPSALMRHPATAGLYVLWASERVRRHYDGSGLSWDFINTPLPHIFNGQRSEVFVRRGLDYWARPLRYGRSGHRLFMFSLMAEGGIPVSVLENASHHAQVLRQMIEEIGTRGGVEMLGEETARDIAKQKMRYLPGILQNEDTIALFVDLAQAIFELRREIPSGLSPAEIENWLNQSKPNWQNELPLRVTPQVIDNIIRPSLTATHRQIKSSAWPARREIHSDFDGKMYSVAVLAPRAMLPLAALPPTEATVLRLLPKFSSSRPLIYRVTRSSEITGWELEQIGGRGPETIPFSLFETLEFDVMADSQNLGTWIALSSQPHPSEVPSLWAGPEQDGQPSRLQILSGGRSRESTVWAMLSENADFELEPGLEAKDRQTIDGVILVQLNGKGMLSCDGTAVRITTGSQDELEPASLYLLGKVLPQWKLASGEFIHLGDPTVYGQKGEAQLRPVPSHQLERQGATTRTYGAVLSEWINDGERLAVTRHVRLPAEAELRLKEQGDGALSLEGRGLPAGLMLDLVAGDDRDSFVTDGGSFALELPPCKNDTAFVSLSIQELSTGKRVRLVAPWPSAQPRILRGSTILAQRDNAIAFDELRDLSVFAPGNRTRMTVSLVDSMRSFEIPVSGTVPLSRFEPQLRKMLLNGSADSTVTLSLYNASGQTGRVILRRYHATMAIDGDLLKLGMPADRPRAETMSLPQTAGAASLDLLQVETGEVQRIAAQLDNTSLNLRAATGIEIGLWLVQGRFNGQVQRPVVWQAGTPETGLGAIPTRRSDRITSYRAALIEKAERGTTADYWKRLLHLILAARDGGDPAMLDQFHALAQTPVALTRMLFSLGEADLKELFGLDSYWNVLWSGLHAKDVSRMADESRDAMQNALIMANIAPSAAQQMATNFLVEKLAFLRAARPDMSGLIAVTLWKANLLASIAHDNRFQGLLTHNPRAALNEAIQSIIRSDPQLPRGVQLVQPSILTASLERYQRAVQIFVGAVLAVAEQAMGLRPMLEPQLRLDITLIEAAGPELFAATLQPAIMLAFAESQKQS